MANPATKNDLESDHFLSTSAAAQTRLTGCLRSDGANIRPFSQPSEAIQAIKEGLNRVQPTIPGMSRITDPQNTFQESMVEAVLAYKAFNGIIRAGQKLDNIVGRGTLARLDTELKNLGNPAPNPIPVPLEFGSNQWRFTFFGNKGFFGKGIFSLFVASTQLQDSLSFDITEVFSSGNLRSGFQGSSQGTFSTTKKMLAKDFGSSVCDFSISRLSRTLQGNMQIQKDAATGFINVSFAIPRFKDESLSIDDGTLRVRGTLPSGRP